MTKCIKHILLIIPMLIMVSCSNDSLKTREEISEEAITCVNNFINAIDEEDYNTAHKYCFPYIFGDEEYSMTYVLQAKDIKVRKADVKVSPNVIIVPNDTLQKEFEQFKFNYAIVTAKIRGSEHQFYVVFDKGAEPGDLKMNNDQGQRLYGNTKGRAVIVDADGFLPAEMSIDKGSFPNIEMPDSPDVFSYAISQQNDNYKNRTYSKVIDLGNSNTEGLPFTKAFGGYINYQLADKARPANLIIETTWEKLLAEGTQSERGVNMGQLEAKAIFSTGLGFKLQGTKIVDSYNLLDLKKYYSRHYSDIDPSYIMPSSYYFSFSIGDAELIEAMKQEEEKARNYTRLFNR